MTRFPILLFVFLLAGQAAADGGFVWRNRDVDIREPQQKALIIHHDGWQDLILSVTFAGAAEDFGWLVPLPSRSELSTVYDQLFEDLSRLTQEPDFGRVYIEAREKSAGAVYSPQVTIQRVGVYEIALLEGGSGAGLQAWLDEHGFFLTPSAGRILETYLSHGWVFAAMRISPESATEETTAALQAGEIEPVHFRFRAREPVFPLRISSIVGHASEVLIYTLSRHGLVPATVDGVGWDLQCFSKLRWWLAKKHPWLQDQWARLADADQTIVLTKSRAVFQPDQMQDLSFRPYPYGDLLAGETLRQRTDAVTYIGRKAPADGAILLERFLKNATPPDPMARPAEDELHPGQDIASALWALGEVGGPGSAGVLESWATGPSSPCRLEAFAALKQLDSHAALMTAIEILEHPILYYESNDEKDLVTWKTLEHLIAHGDSTCWPGLSRIIDAEYDPVNWNEGHGGSDAWLGKIALLAAAACGHEPSQTEIERILKQAATYCSQRWNYENGFDRQGASNDYPDGIIPGRALVYAWWFHLPNGEIVDDVIRWLKDRPVVRDACLRSVGLAPWLTPGIENDMRAVLLGQVGDYGTAERAMLLRIWHHAVQKDERFTVPIPTGWYRDPVAVDLNIEALAAAYALGRQGDVDILNQLWAETGWEDPQLKGELAVALTITDVPAAIPAVRDYVEQAWEQPYDVEVSYDLWYRRSLILQFLRKHRQMDKVGRQVPAGIRGGSVAPGWR